MAIPALSTALAQDSIATRLSATGRRSMSITALQVFYLIGSATFSTSGENGRMKRFHVVADGSTNPK